MSIDIVMPVYDTRSDHLLEAVYSILNQTHKDFRLIIVDDGSQNEHTIKALEIIRHLDSRISVHHFTHKGTPLALNQGHDLCKSEYVAIMGSDDIAHPDRLLLQLKYIENNPDVDVLGTGLVAFLNDDPWRKTIFDCVHPEIISDNGFIVNHGTSVYRLSLAKKIGQYNPLLLRGQDRDFFNRMFNHGAKIHNLTDILYWWRRY